MTNDKSSDFPFLYFPFVWANWPNGRSRPLGAIAGDCRDRKINFVTFFYRAKKEALRPAARLQMSEDLLAAVQGVGTQNNFSVVDIDPWWGKENMRLATNSIFDSHPNERGHEFLAAGMADFLINQGRILMYGHIYQTDFMPGNPYCKE